MFIFIIVQAVRIGTCLRSGALPLTDVNRIRMQNYTKYARLSIGGVKKGQT